jgi:hypothetical protein
MKVFNVVYRHGVNLEQQITAFGCGCLQSDLFHKNRRYEVSFFSGQKFTVDAGLGISGVCDFLLSRSREQFEVEAPVVVILEAKKADLNTGMGQCMAELTTLRAEATEIP